MQIKLTIQGIYDYCQVKQYEVCKGQTTKTLETIEKELQDKMKENCKTQFK